LQRQSAMHHGHSHDHGHGHSHGGHDPFAGMTPGAMAAAAAAAAAPIPMDSEGKAYPVDPAYRMQTQQQQQQQQQVQQDTSNWDMVKACQYGVVPRVRELLNSGFDANTLDSQGVSPLHWAAINNRLEIMQMLVNHGAIVDRPGGDLQGTPLHWACRQGNLSACCLLMRMGANPLLTDAEGLACLHLAAQFGYTHILAYLLAKGADPNLRDCKGMTALMWTALRVLQPDATRVLLAFDANPNASEPNSGNTPAHFAALGGNQIVLGCLDRAGVDWTAINANGETPVQILQQKKMRWLAERLKEMMSDRGMLRDSSASAGGFFRSLATRENRRWCMLAVPSLLLACAGLIFHAAISYVLKLALLVGLAVFFRLVFSRKCLDLRYPMLLPFGLAVGSEVILTSTCVLLMFPYNSYGDIVLFTTVISGMFYFHWRCAVRDPGFLKIDKTARVQSIVRTCEDPSASFDNFCSTCLIQKPLRSKHCDMCGRCVARMDHHCPWVYNCVGVANHRTFVGYLTGVVLGTSMFLKMFLSYVYHPDSSCSLDWDTVGLKALFTRTPICSTWAFFCACLDSLYLFWVAMLLLSQLWQMLCVNMTTNERFNSFRYAHFQTSMPKVLKSPFNQGVFKNFKDYFLTHSSASPWFHVYDVDDLKSPPKPPTQSV
ncbi:hypothetical protein BOX15_Mlig003792g1, partial [Macrostomum lignano]